MATVSRGGMVAAVVTSFASAYPSMAPRHHRRTHRIVA